MSSIGFPLLLIPVAICNIIAFLMPDLSFAGPVPLFSITLRSHDVWTVTLNDVLVALSILLLWLEVIRATRPAPKYFVDHFLSLVVAGAAAYEFVMLPKFGNATFFLITLTAIVDFLAGISLRARRPRRVALPVEAPVPVHVEAPRADVPVAPAPTPATIPSPEPLPSATPVVPPATSVAEAVLADRSVPPRDIAPERKVEPVKVEPAKVEPAKVEPRIEPDLNSWLESKLESKPEPKPDTPAMPRADDFRLSKPETLPVARPETLPVPVTHSETVPPEVVAQTSPGIEADDLQPGKPTVTDHQPKR
ncbi:MAG: hypothetical protein ABW213_07710 [Tardiphaga sp.]